MQSDLSYWILEQEKDVSGKTGEMQMKSVL